jgi:hypothetical protein
MGAVERVRMLEESGLRLLKKLRLSYFYRGELSEAPPVIVHLVKSISCWQPLQICFLSNSSEKISASFPQLGHLQTKDFRPLNCSKPGQCLGMLILTSFFRMMNYERQTTNLKR